MIMAKEPVAGHTKTRLCPPLSYEQAASLYDCFLRDVLDTARSVLSLVPELDLAIAYTPHGAQATFRQMAPDTALVQQLGSNLNERLEHVLMDRLEMGYSQVMALSSDSPTLPAQFIADGFHLLDGPDGIDVVLGPCEDGGYYCIGMAAPHMRLVRDVQMSTPHVLDETLSIARSSGLRVALLPKWYDVDTVRELDHMRMHLPILPDYRAPRTRHFLLNTPLPLCE